MSAQQPPEVIWLQCYGNPEYWDDPEVPQKDEETTWADEPVHDSDVRYIRADVAEDRVKAADLAARLECEDLALGLAGLDGTALQVADAIKETMK